jgi:hypothetical protein
MRITRRLRNLKANGTSLAATLLCGLAIAAYSALAPSPSYAGPGELDNPTCLWAGQEYTVGACVNHQKCTPGGWDAVGTC